MWGFGEDFLTNRNDQLGSCHSTHLPGLHPPTRPSLHVPVWRETSFHDELPRSCFGVSIAASCSGRRRRCGAAEFFFGYLVAISFPNRIDVWGKLCTHFDIPEGDFSSAQCDLIRCVEGTSPSRPAGVWQFQAGQPLKHARCTNMSKS